MNVKRYDKSNIKKINMMNINWKILNLKRTPTSGIVIKVTYAMHCQLEEFSDRHIGIIELEGDNTDPNFILFENLTEAIVLDWIKTKIGQERITQIQDEIQTRLQNKLDKKNNPDSISGLPWAI